MPADAAGIFSFCLAAAISTACCSVAGYNRRVSLHATIRKPAHEPCNSRQPASTAQPFECQRPRTVAHRRRHVAHRRVEYVGAAASGLHRAMPGAGRIEFRPRRHLWRLQRRRAIWRSAGPAAGLARQDGAGQQVRHQAALAAPPRSRHPALRHERGAHHQLRGTDLAPAAHGPPGLAADPPSRPADGFRRNRWRLQPIEARWQGAALWRIEFQPPPVRVPAPALPAGDEPGGMLAAARGAPVRRNLRRLARRGGGAG